MAMIRLTNIKSGLIGIHPQALHLALQGSVVLLQLEDFVSHLLRFLLPQLRLGVVLSLHLLHLDLLPRLHLPQLLHLFLPQLSLLLAFHFVMSHLVILAFDHLVQHCDHPGILLLRLLHLLLVVVPHILVLVPNSLDILAKLLMHCLQIAEMLTCQRFNGRSLGFLRLRIDQGTGSVQRFVDLRFTNFLKFLHLGQRVGE